MSKRDYYEILGVNKTATNDEIKKAYRKLAKTEHPDMGGSEEKFKEIAEAYDVLSDTNKKTNYDQFGHSNSRESQGHDVFAAFMRRNGFTSRQRGEDLNLTIKMTLEDIFNGVNKKFKYNKKVLCTPCKGAGGTNSKTCTTCNGAGMVVERYNTIHGQFTNATQCPTCRGEGITYEDICVKCSGSGIEVVEDTIDIDIPAGVLDGMKMILQGKGNAIKNGGVGDLVVTILELPHNKFVRNINDLKIRIQLTYPQLVLGDKVETPTIDGSKIRINVPEYTKVGDILRVQTKGLKDFNTGIRGDMMVEVDLYVPTDISEEEKSLIKELKNFEKKS